MAMKLQTSLTFVGTVIYAAAVTFDLGWVSLNTTPSDFLSQEFKLLFGELTFCSQSQSGLCKPVIVFVMSCPVHQDILHLADNSFKALQQL